MARKRRRGLLAPRGLRKASIVQGSRSPRTARWFRGADSGTALTTPPAELRSGLWFNGDSLTKCSRNNCFLDTSYQTDPPRFRRAPVAQVFSPSVTACGRQGRRHGPISAIAACGAMRCPLLAHGGDDSRAFLEQAVRRRPCPRSASPAPNQAGAQGQEPVNGHERMNAGRRGITTRRRHAWPMPTATTMPTTPWCCRQTGR